MGKEKTILTMGFKTDLYKKSVKKPPTRTIAEMKVHYQFAHAFWGLQGLTITHPDEVPAFKTKTKKL